MKMELDNQIKGQLSLDDFMCDELGMIAVADVFAVAKKQMNVTEYKAFIYALTKIRWTETNSSIVELNKQELARAIGIKDNDEHVSTNLRRALYNLAKHSEIHVTGATPDISFDGTFINAYIGRGKQCAIQFNELSMKYFENLEKEYITMWADDLIRMNSERSIIFYEQLRLHSDTRKTSVIEVGVKSLKELFNIPQTGKGSYMRDSGGFNRTAFEQRIIEPLVEDLKKCEMIHLQIMPDGKYYEKIKKGGRVYGYRFAWTVTDNPRVATAEEVEQIREAEKIDPQVLKVAKDIVQGKGKKTEKKAQANFTQRSDNFNAIAEQIMKNQN